MTAAGKFGIDFGTNHRPHYEIGQAHILPGVRTMKCVIADVRHVAAIGQR